MSEQKPHQFRPPLYNQESAKPSGPGPVVRRAGDASLEQQGWEAYRKWLSRVSARPVERPSVDHSIYSWKGYNSWAERIRETWKSEEADG
jgi:hypothetical protein